MSSFLVNMNFILIYLQLLIKSTSESNGDYRDKLKNKHVTATVFFDIAVNAEYILPLFNPH